MKKRIGKNYRKLWIFLGVLCVLVSVVSVGAADAPARPEPAAPEGAQVQVMEKAASVNDAVHMATAATGDPLQDGADRLAALQQNDGGWDWPLDDGDPNDASPVNTVGPIAKGLAIAYLHTGDAAHLAALQDAGALLLTKTNNFSPSDGYLAAQLDAIFGGTTYVDHVQAYFYEPLAAGTYDRNGAGTLYDTVGYVNLIRTNRSGTQANMAAWDIGMGLVGAAAAEADTAPWITGVKAEIDELDGSAYYDVIGLAGSVYGLAYVSEDYNPTAGEHAAASDLADLAAILASYQIDGGGFAWNSLYVIPNDFNETIQETAYAVLALSEFDHAAYQSEILGAVEYMKSVQLLTGGWENYVGSTSGENNEITGEAMWAIGTNAAAVVPEIADPLVCDEATVEIAINDVSDLYGYEFRVLYDQNLVSAKGSFQFGWFDTNGSGTSPANWQADCDAGVCQFARTEYNPDPAISGSGVVASIDFDSALPALPAGFTVQVTDVVLTDRNGFAISPVDAGSVNINVCGNATVQGKLSLQGRVTPDGPGPGTNDFLVTLIGPYGSFSAPPTINPDGTYTVSGVKYTAGAGTDYVIRAEHSLYLMNELDPLTVSGNITDLDTRLLGGDANNNGKVGIGDLSCIGTDFGTSNHEACGAFPNSTDINDDGIVNIQDLAIGGGNYSLEEALSW